MLCMSVLYTAALKYEFACRELGPYFSVCLAGNVRFTLRLMIATANSAEAANSSPVFVRRPGQLSALSASQLA